VFEKVLDSAKHVIKEMEKKMEKGNHKKRTKHHLLCISTPGQNILLLRRFKNLAEKQDIPANVEPKQI